MNDGIPGVPCSCPRNSEHLHGIFIIMFTEQSTEVVHKQKTVHKLSEISLKICLLYKYLQDNFSLSKNTALVSAIKGKNCQQ